MSLGGPRTPIENYAEAVGKFVEQGIVTRQDADAAIAEEARVHAALDARLCPACAGPATRTLDSRQAGPTQIAGKWFQYRCKAECGKPASLHDRCEPVGES